MKSHGWKGVALRMVAVSWLASAGTEGAAFAEEAPPIDLATGSTQDIEVTAKPFHEDRVFGPNQQPEWTARRRFTNADVYVQAPWQAEASFDWIARTSTEGEDGDPGKPSSHKLVQEIELGLPYRFQLDLELTQSFEEDDSRFDSVSIEARWALAEWGEIPLNPTLYDEWVFRNGEADSFELKLLLGDAVAPRLYTAVNFFYEQQVGDEREQEFAVSHAWSYSVLDRRLGVGIEARLTVEREREGFEEEEDEAELGEREKETETEVMFAIGPSAQWRITDDLSLVVAPLFGVTEETPTVESFVFLRWYFGPGAEGEEEEGAESIETPSMQPR